MTALVTGAHGFIGRHVARALAQQGYLVTGIGHGIWSRDEWRVWGLDAWHLSDVTLEALCEYGGEPAVIAHCAGGGSVSYSVSHPFQDYQRTVDTALAVLEYMRTVAPGTCLVIPSSAAVYGAVENIPIPTCSPLRPESPYGAHKKIVEELCFSYAKHFGLKVALVRMFSVYGKGLRKQLLWDACTKIHNGNFAFMGTGRETRDLLHVEDAAQLMLVALKNASSVCPVVNGGSGNAVEVRMVLEVITAALGAEYPIQFSGEQRLGDPLHYWADIDEAQLWGWRPRREWHEEIAAYVDWFVAGAP